MALNVSMATKLLESIDNYLTKKILKNEKKLSTICLLFRSFVNMYSITTERSEKRASTPTNENCYYF